jgi:DNA-binding transcriptional LysR family regulator
LVLAAPLSRIDLNLLIPLNALLIEQNVTKAADRISITQPSMSSALAKLRRHFDDPLLVRDGRGFVLTPLAQSLRAPVTALLIAAREVLTAGRSFDPALDHRTFTIAASDYVAAVLIQPALRGLTADAPNVRINVESLPDDVLDGLRNLRYDLLVWPLQLPLPGLLEFPNSTLFADEFVAVVDEDNELVEAPLSAKSLAAMPAVRVVGPGRGKVAAEAKLEELGLAQQTVVTVESFALALRMVCGTDLVTLTQRRLFEQVAPAYRLREVPLDLDGATLTEAMFWHPRHVRDPAHQWLRTRLITVAAGL